jgi:hypothetical protein
MSRLSRAAFEIRQGRDLGSKLGIPILPSSLGQGEAKRFLGYAFQSPRFMGIKQNRRRLDNSGVAYSFRYLF